MKELRRLLLRKMVRVAQKRCFVRQPADYHMGN
jgi:hypothetical protein